MPRSDCVYRGERTIQGENISPFVHLALKKTNSFRKGEWISVGNISTSQDFHSEAVIKSFEFGASDGVVASIEILDERGGAFDKSVSELFTNLRMSEENKGMAAIWWGWIITNCDTGATRLEKAGPVYMSMEKMVVTFSGGKVKYKIECRDVLGSTKDITSEDSIWGDDENPMGIKDALKNMMNSTDPKINIEWINKDGKSNVEFKNDPKAVWETNGLDKLSTIVQWLENFITTNDRGVVPIWDYTKEEPTLLLMEAPDLTAQNATENSNKFKGIYVVNGGKNSNVISFNPSISWQNFYAYAADGGGIGSGPNTGKIAWKNDELVKTPKKSENLGKKQTITTNRAATWVHGKNAPDEINKNQIITGEASAAFAADGVVNAELKIQGSADRKFWHPKELIGKFVHIVLINPYHLRESSGCEWLAEPVCNDMFTSKKWKVMGVSHSIKEGSFVTTIKVILTGPFGGAGESKALKNWAPEME